ncbi:MAG: hypothetical protein ACR2KV_09970, partial [Solirubrobacteraceae bacterium]
MSAEKPSMIRLDTRPMWRVRASGSMTRWVLYVTAGVGVATTIRFAIAPPRPAAGRVAPVVVADRGAEGFATLFARRYLTWDAASPAEHQQALAQFIGGTIDPDAGLGLPTRGSQRVEWAEIVQTRRLGPDEHVYTVAAATSATTISYLSVDVVRDATGELRLGRYPALIGPPLMRPALALDSVGVGGVTDPEIPTVVGRALRNSLAGSAQNLTADLTPRSA